MAIAPTSQGPHNQPVLEPSGPEARARVFVHVLYEFRDY